MPGRGKEQVGARIGITEARLEGRRAAVCWLVQLVQNRCSSPRVY